ncbi:MAG: cysteine desulfurase family protein [Zavarzinella sp.]
MIYLDHHATTPTRSEVLEVMHRASVEAFGNPSSPHHVGKVARQWLTSALAEIATCLDAHPDEILFTSGATESNNLAIFGLMPDNARQIITSDLEHPCVLAPVEYLGKSHLTVSKCAIKSDGQLNHEDFIRNIGDQPGISTLQLVNHEMGAIQQVSKLSHEIRRLNPQMVVHCDAAQGVGKIPVSFRQLHVDSLSASGHKFGGPKGIGLLIVKKSLKLRPLLHGGHQQHGKRPGTESVPLICGLASALTIANKELTANFAQVSLLKQKFLDCFSGTLHEVNSPTDGSPYVVNIAFPGCRAEMLLIKLDLAGIACSAGSACSSGSLLPSPVLKAIGVPLEKNRSSLRFSFHAQQSVEEITRAGRTVAGIVSTMASVG